MFWYRPALYASTGLRERVIEGIACSTTGDQPRYEIRVRALVWRAAFPHRIGGTADTAAANSGHGR
jgi:hypothetical protein